MTIGLGERELDQHRLGQRGHVPVDGRDAVEASEHHRRARGLQRHQDAGGDRERRRALRPAAFEPGQASAGQHRQRQQPQPAEADDGANALQRWHVIEEPVIAGHRGAERQHDGDRRERHHRAGAVRPPGRGVGQGDSRQRQHRQARERAAPSLRRTGGSTPRSAAARRWPGSRATGRSTAPPRRTIAPVPAWCWRGNRAAGTGPAPARSRARRPASWRRGGDRPDPSTPTARRRPTPASPVPSSPAGNWRSATAVRTTPPAAAPPSSRGDPGDRASRRAPAAGTARAGPACGRSAPACGR